MMLNFANTVESNIRSADRVLVLEPMDNAAPKNVLGNTDTRLFNGGNNLHAIMDTETCLWSLRYEKGVIPEEFKQQFTSFSALMKHVQHYYKKRNIKVSRVED